MVQVEKRIIAVSGATGLQGGSVARHLLKDGFFRVRAITRKPISEKALDLQERGAEVVYADFENPQSIVAALQGVYGVFGVTNFWESMDGEKEIQAGYTLVDAARVNGVQHFIWSTVSEPPPGLHVEHWASKAKINRHLIASGLARTSLYTTFYYENFLNFDFCKLTRVPSEFLLEQKAPIDREKLLASWPLLYTDGPIGGYSVNETGVYVLEAFKDPNKWIDSEFIPPDVFTPRDFIDALNETLSNKAEVALMEVDWSAFEKSRMPTTEHIWTNMAAFYKAGGRMRDMCGLTSSNSDVARMGVVEMGILPTRIGMREWVRMNSDKILAAAL